MHNGHKALRFIMISFVFLVEALEPFVVIFVILLIIRLLNNLIWHGLVTNPMDTVRN